jgi:hypothetical protein
LCGHGDIVAVRLEEGGKKEEGRKEKEGRRKKEE